MYGSYISLHYPTIRFIRIEIFSFSYNFSTLCTCLLISVPQGVALRVLFRIYETPEREEVWPEVEKRISQSCGDVLKQFVWEVPREAREAWGRTATELSEQDSAEESQHRSAPEELGISCR